MSKQQGSYNTYIGARYVPIFDGQWNNAKAYEPLVIVEYQGNSYTSKTYVPIGADINNEDYWALTGNYNAQVEAYRQQVKQYQETVETFDERITTNANNIQTQTEKLSNLNLTNKNVHFFGDSLTWGLTGGAQSSLNYPKVFSDITNCNSFNHAVNGATVTEISTEWGWLYNQIDSVDLSNADYIFIQMGINDWGRGYPIGKITDDRKRFKGAYYQSLQLAMTKAKTGCRIICMTLFPNANWFTKQPNSIGEYVEDFNNAIIDVCNKCNVQVINTTDSIGINEFNYNKILTDGTHMSDIGYANIGRSIVQSMSSGYSVPKLYSGENIINGQDFPNNFQLSSEFPNGTGNIVLDLKSGAKWSHYNKYRFNANTSYTLSCDIYNENVTVPYSSNFTVVVFRLVYDLSGDNQKIINIAQFYNLGQGVTHCSCTFNIAETNDYTLYAICSHNLEVLNQVTVANLSIVRGEYESIPSNKVDRSYILNQWGENIMPVSENQYILFSSENGIVKINGQFSTTAEIPVSSNLVNAVPQIGNMSNNKGKTYYLKGFDSTANEFVPFVINIGGSITNLTVLPANHTFVITDCLPLYF